jgi:CDP-diacylglycerol--serine O-phosphatidyltransferase
LKFIGFFDYTTWLTYVSLASALIGMLQASKGHLGAAVFCILFSGFCDMFDGIVARTKKDRTQDQKNFGIQIDSLTDVIAFGVTPAVVFYFHGVQSTFGVIILIAYVLCGLVRLAFFNVLETKRQANPNESACLKSFRGMPITFSAMITPVVCFIGWLLPHSISIWLYHIAPLLMGFFFIYDISIPKLDVGSLLFGKKK